MVKHTETIRGQKQFVTIIGTVACHECVCACVCVFMCVEGAFTKNRVRLTQSIVVKLSQTQAKQY